MTGGLTAEDARRVLEANTQLLLKKVAEEGRVLTAQERSLLESVAAGDDVQSPTSGFADNQVELAGILGVERRTIHRWLKEPGNPGAASNGSYSISAWKAFQSQRKRKTGTGPEYIDATQERARQVLLQNQKLEFQISILKKDYVRSIDVELWAGAIVTQAKRVLDGGPASIAPQVVGVSIPEAERILRQWINAALTILASDPMGWTKRAGETADKETK